MFCMGRLAPDPPGANPSLASAPSEANPSLAPDFLKLPGQTSTSHKTKHFSKDMEGGFAEAKDKTSRKCVPGLLLLVTFPNSTCFDLAPVWVH